ncbi:DUF721 domain-containing protein [Hankyongella ginsenosidimutans]|uniref:DUF721 domain-containing protein n=2 Tax=Hankyongella ginsenosidimutans TaxID=1763828 RepID=A0A4D7C7F6_9SPHN|nr:DUF721 domain-containing protein [Hankyongella ginsenosidimutans]
MFVKRKGLGIGSALWHRRPMSDQPSPRRRGVRAISELLPAQQRRALRQYGFLKVEIVNRWTEIVGPTFAQSTLPAKLSFPPGKRNGGTLTVTVDGPVGLHLRHVEPQIVERVNGFFGYPAVARLAIRQGPVPQPMPRPAAPPPLDARTMAHLQHALSGIGNTNLRQAMARLGQAVLTDNPHETGDISHATLGRAAKA